MARVLNGIQGKKQAEHQDSLSFPLHEDVSRHSSRGLSFPSLALPLDLQVLSWSGIVSETSVSYGRERVGCGSGLGGD